MSKKGSSGKSSVKSTRMTKETASRIQSASDKNTNSKSSQSGFAGRAQSTADKRSSKQFISALGQDWYTTLASLSYSAEVIAQCMLAKCELIYFRSDLFTILYTIIPDVKQFARRNPLVLIFQGIYYYPQFMCYARRTIVAKFGSSSTESTD